MSESSEIDAALESISRGNLITSSMVLTEVRPVTRLRT
jgi:hypothetical protein